MEGVADIPITINVGGEVFMTSLATIQSLPDTLLANLANTLFPQNLNQSQFAPTHNTGDQIIPTDQHHETQTDFSNRFRFIHVISTNDNNSNISDGNTRTPGDLGKSEIKRDNDFTTNQNSRIHGQIPNGPSVNQPQPILPLITRPGASMNATPMIFVDRNPAIMPYILDTYRQGQLHLPSNVCSPFIRSELQFWGISEDLVSPCCWKKFSEGVSSIDIINIISKAFFNPFDSQPARDALSGLEKIWLTMERPSYSLAAKIWCAIYFTFIFISMVVFSVSSLPDNREINPHFQDIKDDIDTNNKSVSLVRMMSFTGQVDGIAITNNIIDVFFTVEFLVRLVTCPGKIHFLRNTHNIIDIVILAVTWMNFFLELGFTRNSDDYEEVESHVNIIFSCMVVVRVLRISHLQKHMPALKLMYLSTRESLQELTLLLAIVGSAVLLFGTAMFLAETFDKLPGEMGSFSHVPIAMWWAIVTMTTVGYGDFYPTTTAGYFVGVVCAVSGLLLMAMPIAIIATNFSDYYYNMTSRDQSLRQKTFLENHRNKFPYVNFPGNDNTSLTTAAADGRRKVGIFQRSKVEDFSLSNEKKQESLGIEVITA